MAKVDEKDTPKYKHPQILILDMQPTVLDALKSKGYNVSQGSLGKPYKVQRSAKYDLFERNHHLPRDYKEQEIVILDMQYIVREKEIELEEYDAGLETWWVSLKDGYVNPRLLMGRMIQSDFDRILHSGGVFVIFASPIEKQDYYWGDQGYARRDTQQSFELENWNFLSIFDYLVVGVDHGSSVYISEDLDKGAALTRLLAEHLDSVEYNCTVGMLSYKTEEWRCLLKNKYNHCIGGVIGPKENREGWVFILPDLEDKATFVANLVDQVLPSIVPKLFPEIESASWVVRPEYEFPRVAQLRQEIVIVREGANATVAALQEKIGEEQDQTAYLFDLLRETGDALVQAVHKALLVLGFQNVIDVDKQLKEEGKQRQNLEDLQIQDKSPLLVCEIKGIAPKPSDDDALKVQKYVVLRMREQKRTDVQGLTVINHQRHLPPLDRDNSMPFRKEILVAAEEQSIGLLTAWDLHRLTRSYLQNGWNPEVVMPVFYRIGRIEPVPSHYEYVGTIERYIEEIGVIGIEVKGASLQKGDRIAFELPVIFHEQECTSLEFDNQPIDVAEAGQVVGTKTDLTKDQVSFGTRVFRIVKAEEHQTTPSGPSGSSEPPPNSG